MNPKHGLTEETVMQIAAVLGTFPEVKKAVLFGSRAKGTYKPGSDIDLALIGDHLDWRLPGQIDDALDDLLLPYRFSLIILDDQTDAEIAGHIRRVGMDFYEKTAAVPGGASSAP